MSTTRGPKSPETQAKTVSKHDHHGETEAKAKPKPTTRVKEHEQDLPKVTSNQNETVEKNAKEEDIILKTIQELKRSLTILDIEFTEVDQRFKEALNKESEINIKELIQLRITLANKSAEKVKLGLEEVGILSSLSEYIEYLEVQKMIMKLQIKRLLKENEWLNEEETHLTQQVGKVNMELIAMEKERNQFKFLHEMRENEQQQKITDDFLNELDDYEKLPPQLQALQNMIKAYCGQGKYDVVIAMVKQTMTEYEEKEGKETPEYAALLSLLGLVYRDASNYTEAINNLQLSFEYRKRIYGMEHQCVAATANNLAVVLLKKSKFKEAESLCRLALDIRKKLLGPDHLFVAKQLNNLALLCQNAENMKSEEIEKLYLEALRIYELNHDNPEIKKNKIKTKNNIIALYVKRQRYSDAEVMLKQIFGDAILNDNLEVKTELFKIIENTNKNKKKEVAEHLVRTYGIITDNILIATVKNLSTIYKKNNKGDACQILEEWLIRSAFIVDQKKKTKFTEDNTKALEQIKKQQKAAKKEKDKQEKALLGSEKKTGGLFGLFKKK